MLLFFRCCLVQQRWAVVISLFCSCHGSRFSSTTCCWCFPASIFSTRKKGRSRRLRGTCTSVMAVSVSLVPLLQFSVRTFALNPRLTSNPWSLSQCGFMIEDDLMLQADTSHNLIAFRRHMEDTSGEEVRLSCGFLL